MLALLLPSPFSGKAGFLFCLFFTFFLNVSWSQTVPFPDTRVYDEISPWGHTDKGTNWDTSPYLPFIYKEIWFRIMPPNGVTYDRETDTWNFSDPDKKYPLSYFQIGGGKFGDDNNYPLANGGQDWMNAVSSDEFPGFVVYPQNMSRGGQPPEQNEDLVRALIDLLPVDRTRLYMHGTSNGAKSVWLTLRAYPRLFAAATPFSGISEDGYSPDLLFTPIRQYQGGNDLNPAPGYTESILNQFEANGGATEYVLYSDLGHGTWNRGYSSDDYFSWLMSHKINDIHVLFDNREICPEDPIDVTMGFTPGFDSYEWRKDGVLLAGENTHTLHATELGTYEGRVLLEGEWTAWSDPAEIRQKEPTQTPPIAVLGGNSPVIPSPDGRNTVDLVLPSGYATYQWEDASTSQVIGTSEALVGIGPGSYRATVTEVGGCSSLYSDVFNVVDANGPNPPDGVIALRTQVLSKTEVQLLWDQNPSPLHNEIGFEVYRAVQHDGVFEYLGLTAADASGYVDSGLNPGSEYFYQVRAINNSAASENSSVVSVTTALDEEAPSDPLNVEIAETTASSVSLTWSPSQDNIEVVAYDIYVDGLRSFTTQETEFTVFGLNMGQIYTLSVKARDFAGNESPFSNQVIALPVFSGSPLARLSLDGNYGDISGNGVTSAGVNSPVFTSEEVKVGTHALSFGTTNDFIDLDQGNQFIHRAFSKRTVAFWVKATSEAGIQDIFDEGGSTNGLGIRINNGNIETAVQNNHEIYIIAAPFTSGEWVHVAVTFNEGSLKLFLNAQEVAQQSGISFATVSDHSDAAGLGGTNGGNAFDQNNNNFVGYIDDLYLDDDVLSVAELSGLIQEDIPTIPNERPVAPSNLSATAISHDQIHLSWDDNSTDENGFQLFRSTHASGPFAAIAILEPNTTTYQDVGLQPETTYYYSTVALGPYGASQPVNIGEPLLWTAFDNNADDLSPNNVVSQPRNNPGFSDVTVREGSHSAYFFGANDYFDLDVTNSFVHSRFEERTVAFWLRTNSTDGKQDIFDEGGSTNGFGIRINQGSLELAVQNAHVIYSVSSPLAIDTWAHVTAVYDRGRLSLYINGELTAEQEGLSFSAVEDHSNGGGVGATNGTNAFDEVNNQFDGWIDDLRIYEGALGVSDIEVLMTSADGLGSVATTLALPAPPVAPEGLITTDVGTTSVSLTWTDNSDIEDYYEIFKSIGDNQNYQLLDTTKSPAYADSSLFPHTVYYYQVRAVNVGGVSEFSPELEVTSLNSSPQPSEPIDDIFMHWESNRSVSISATDADGDNIFINPVDFPDFIDFFDEGDGTAGFFIEPEIADVGIYENLKVQFTDLYGGVSVIDFNLHILDNHPPVILPFEGLTLFETEETTITIQVEDQDSDEVTWDFDNLPVFAVIDTSSVNQTSITFSPGSEDEGIYTISISANDGQGGIATSDLSVAVSNYEPNFKVYINFGKNSEAGSPWNNFMVSSAATGSSLGSLVNDVGYVTDISATLETTWNGVQEVGGMPTGIYEDEVRESYFWTNSGRKNIRIDGLDPSLVYNFEFFGSRDKNGDRRTVYTIDDRSVVLEASFNSTETTRIEGVTPNANGQITFGVSNINSNGEFSVGYLNALVVESIDDGGVPPFAPSNLAANFENGEITLSWTDNALNENGFEVFKSVGDTLNFEVLTTLGPDVTSFVDAELSAEEQHYRVRAFNTRGYSGFSTIASVGIINLPPVIEGLDDVTVQAGSQLTVSFQVNDPESDSLAVEANNLPEFATFQQFPDSSIFQFSPTMVHEGVHVITVVADDSQGNLVSKDFEIEVVHKVYERVLVNFSTNGGLVAPSPWNNMLGAPSAGKSVNDLINGENENTGFDITLVDAWAGGNTSGVVTGNDSGIYPDIVMQTYYADNSNNSKKIVLSGLNTAKIYDILFFASRANITEDRKTDYRTGGKSVTLNARDNSSDVAQITGVLADASGEIEIDVNKSTGSPWGYINAIEIRYYDQPILPATPFAVAASGQSKSSISLSWTDNSSSEEGFEIYRSLDQQGGYELIATVPSDSESYNDTGLSRNTVYYYKVRAYNANGTSLDSEVASASTYDRVVYLNFGDENFMASTPWNNTGQFPFVGNVTENLLDDEGLNTGIDMEIISNPGGTTFAASGSLGVVTGDNSGIFPDVVLQSYCWIEQGETASIKFKDLNLNQQYDLIFFASRGADLRGTDYTVGTRSVSLDASFNTSETVLIDGILPNDQGEIHVDMKSMNGAILGYINAVVIQSSSMTTGGLPQARQTAAIQESAIERDAIEVDAKVFPNPFGEVLTVQLHSSNDETAQILIYDQSSRLIHDESFVLSEGNNELPINTSRLEQGVYLLKVLRNSVDSDILRVVKY